MPDKDVTPQVSFAEIDGESLPLTKCVCGEQFVPWEFIISIYREGANDCRKCGRKLYFRASIKVYEVLE